MTQHKQLLLQAARGLILTKGYPATRVDEICSAAGVTKGSFYHHFSSKEDLASQLVDDYFDEVAEALAGSWQELGDPGERLLAFLDQTLKLVKGPLLKRGCLLGSFALDLSATHPEIRKKVEERFELLQGVVEPVIRDALGGRSARAPLSPAILARQFVAVLQGGIVLGKAYDDHGKVVEGLRCYRSMLQILIES
ncbi:MAG: TetR/AcrR family transcriptional regulator [Planctomycetes bacterium]|nr:TetR/AcrR family transcriptional regulator [Planctomycetota bacterium]